VARFSTVIEVLDALDKHFASCTGKNNRQDIIEGFHAIYERAGVELSLTSYKRLLSNEKFDNYSSDVVLLGFWENISAKIRKIRSK
jgi:hypothetical protein